MSSNRSRSWRSSISAIITQDYIPMKSWLPWRLPRRTIRYPICDAAAEKAERLRSSFHCAAFGSGFVDIQKAGHESDVRAGLPEEKIVSPVSVVSINLIWLRRFRSPFFIVLSYHRSRFNVKADSLSEEKKSIVFHRHGFLAYRKVKQFSTYNRKASFPGK